jgi:hypothetical protein
VAKCAEYEQGNAVLGGRVARLSDVSPIAGLWKWRSRPLNHSCCLPVSTITRLVDRRELSGQPPRRDCLIQTGDLFPLASHRRRSGKDRVTNNPLGLFMLCTQLRGRFLAAARRTVCRPVAECEIADRARLSRCFSSSVVPTAEPRSRMFRANHRVLRRIRHN